MSERLSREEVRYWRGTLRFQMWQVVEAWREVKLQFALALGLDKLVDWLERR